MNQELLNKPIYCIHGGEPLQTLEATISIRKQLAAIGFTERKIVEITNTIDLEDLTALTANYSLFANKQLIELQLKKNKLDQKNSKNLISLMNNIPTDTKILIITDKLDSTTKKSKWFTTLKQIGIIIEAKPILENHLPSWIVTRLKKNGFAASAEVINVLTRMYFGNLTALSQIIEQLSICIPAGQLTLDQIKPYIHENADFNIFNLIDATLTLNKEKVGQIFKNLRTTNTEPAIIMWGIVRELRILIKLAFAMEMGKSFAELSKEFGFWNVRANMLRNYLAKTTLSKLEDLLQELSKIDLIIKGLDPGSPWETLLNVYIKMASPSALSFCPS